MLVLGRIKYISLLPPVVRGRPAWIRAPTRFWTTVEEIPVTCGEIAIAGSYICLSSKPFSIGKLIECHVNQVRAGETSRAEVTRERMGIDVTPLSPQPEVESLVL